MKDWRELEPTESQIRTVDKILRNTSIVITNKHELKTRGDYADIITKMVNKSNELYGSIDGDSEGGTEYEYTSRLGGLIL